jgi:YHS domain-containing protein
MAAKLYSFDEIQKMKLLLTILLFAVESAGFSQTDAFRIKQFNLDHGVAIKGYDPVAYFTIGKAVKGKPAFSSAYHGVKYNFASAEDLNSFQANPEKYEPQYGGWCAYAMGHDGSKVEVDPETFKIINGKLFLFYNRFFNNTLKTWNQDESKLQTRADLNWQTILKQST